MCHLGNYSEFIDKLIMCLGYEVEKFWKIDSLSIHSLYKDTLCDLVDINVRLLLVKEFGFSKKMPKLVLKIMLKLTKKGNDNIWKFL